MPKAHYIVFFIATALTIIVTACGRNPKKERIFPDSTPQLMEKLSDKTYQSSSGKRFRVNKEDQTLLLELDHKLFGVKARYNPMQQQLTVNSGSTYYHFNEDEVVDGFETLKDIWSELKAANTTMSDQDIYDQSVFANPIVFDAVCSQSRNGSITKTYPRLPEIDKYANFNVKSVFRDHPKAKQIVAIQVGDGSQKTNLSFQSDKGNHPLQAYLSEEQLIQQRLKESCRQDANFDRHFGSFFNVDNSTGYYDGSSTTYYIPLYRFDSIVFQALDFSSLVQLASADSLFFSTVEVKHNLTNDLGTFFDRLFLSATINYNYYPTSYITDSKSTMISIDLQTKTFSVTNSTNYLGCPVTIEGQLLSEPYYSSRRNPEYKNTIVLDATIQQYTGCPAFAELDTDQELKIYVAPQKRAAEIILVAPGNSKKLVLEGDYKRI